MADHDTSEPMLTAKSLTKRYGSLLALSSASIHAHGGEVLGLLGPNGAGKTTAMKIVTGFMAADEGTVRLDLGGSEPLEVHESPLACRAAIGWMPENVPVYEDMDADQFILFAAEARGVPRRLASERIVAIAAEIGLTPMLRRPIRELSRGYRQRVGLAQALIHDPRLLVLDEPTSGLDPTQLVGLHEYLRSLAHRDGKTVIFSSHILSEVEAVADRIVVLARGSVVFDGTCGQLCREQGGSLTEAFLRVVAAPQRGEAA